MLEPALQQLKCVNNEALLTLLSSTRAERVFCKVIPLSLTLSVCHSVTSSIPRSIIKIQQPLSTQRKTEADNQTHIIHSHNQTKHTHDIQNIFGYLQDRSSLHRSSRQLYSHVKANSPSPDCFIFLYFRIFLCGSEQCQWERRKKGGRDKIVVEKSIFSHRTRINWMGKVECIKMYKRQFPVKNSQWSKQELIFGIDVILVGGWMDQFDKYYIRSWWYPALIFPPTLFWQRPGKAVFWKAEMEIRICGL